MTHSKLCLKRAVSTSTNRPRCSLCNRNGGNPPEAEVELEFKHKSRIKEAGEGNFGVA